MHTSFRLLLSLLLFGAAVPAASAQQTHLPQPAVPFVAALLPAEIAALPILAASPVPVFYGLPAPRRALATPRYPELALRFRRAGAVVASFVVTPAGKVQDAVVLKGFFSECDDEVLRVLRHATFEPARNGDGQPVEARYVVRFMFDLGAS